LGKLASINENQNVHVFNQLVLSQQDSETTDDPQMAKLRALLLRAMKMSKTSSDKTWNQMTPFER
jgi:uncharacterized tellurite resistance protein B-like protein